MFMSLEVVQFKNPLSDIVYCSNWEVYDLLCNYMHCLGIFDI